MAQENENIKKLRELTEGLKQFSAVNPYDKKLFELEQRIIRLESLINNDDKKHPSKGKPDSKKSNRVLRTKKLDSGKGRKDRKVRRV